MLHLKFEELLSLAEDKSLSRPAHMARCTRCSQELESIAAMLSSMRSDRSLEPSREVLARAHSLMPEQAPHESFADRLSRWMGTLVFDSGALAPAAAGARGAAGTLRQLLFTAPHVDLDLACSAGQPPLTLRGQALGREQTLGDITAFRAVTLVRDGSETAPHLASTDVLGVFAFEDLEPGRYRLELELDDACVTAEFDLGSGDQLS